MGLTVAREVQTIRHPFRTALVLFAGTGSLVAIGTPFVPEVNPLLFLAVGLSYCFCLVVFAIGVDLARPSRVVRYWSLSAVIPAIGVVAFWLLLRCDPDTMWRILPALTQGVLAAIAAWLAAGSIVAGFGWMKYLRFHRRVGRTEQSGEREPPMTRVL